MLLYNAALSHHSTYVLLLLLLCCPVHTSSSTVPHLSPFFFLCNYHGTTQNYGLKNGDVVVSVQIEGNPQAYVPGKFYQINILSSETFDSFMMTGLYTTTADIKTVTGSRPHKALSQGGQNLMCSIVHSQVSPQPMRSITFVWLAPPTGTGCINFLATATHGQQLLFKDTTVMQLCEEGASSIEAVKPALTEVNSDSFLLRDDFESDDDFDHNIWSSQEGARLSSECGSVVHGQAAVFCDSDGRRDLVTVPLNLTSARVLQFSIGGGKCRSNPLEDQEIVVSYGTDDCTQWTAFDKIRAPISDTPEVHIVGLPLPARTSNVCLKFFQQPNSRKNLQSDSHSAILDAKHSSKDPGHSTLGYKPTTKYTPTLGSTKTTKDARTSTLGTTASSSTLGTTTSASTLGTTTSASTLGTTPSTSTLGTTPSTSTLGSTLRTSTLGTTTSTSTLGSTASTSTLGSTASTSTLGTTPSTSTMGATPSTSTLGSTDSTSTMGTTPSTSTMGTTPSTSTLGTTPSTSTLGSSASTSTLGSTASTSTLGSTASTSTMGTTPSTSTYALTQASNDTDLFTETFTNITADPDSKPWNSTQIVPEYEPLTSTEKDIVTTDYFGLVYPNDEPQDDIILVPYHKCWAIDHIVVVNTANPPSEVRENFDPINPSNWIFFPGAQIEHQCQSHGNALVFGDRNQTTTYAVTRELNFDVTDVRKDASLFVDFSNGISSLKVDNGHVGTECGIVKEGKSLIFNGKKKRQVCTSKFDLRDVSTVRFYFQYGGNICHSSAKSPPVLMYLQDEDEHTLVIRNLEAEFFQVPQLVSYPVVNVTTHKKSHGKVSLCLLQKSSGGVDMDVWAIDDLTLLPLLPKESKEDGDKVLQATVNLQCGKEAEKQTSVSFEFSTDHGASWNEFYVPCLPSTCSGHHQSLSSLVTAKELSGWNRITLPVPYAAQTPNTRFRAIYVGDVPSPWAIDDVFIGSCNKWCNGHGNCIESGCSCDFGYEGDACEKSVIPVISSFQENFEDPSVTTTSSLIDSSGGSVGYQCGVVSSGKALVFNKGGVRSLTTTEINSTSIGSVQFTLRIGSQSVMSSCPPPDAPWENVLLEYSCNGGISWSLLSEFQIANFQQPRSASISLPKDARQNLCQFRWRQPKHSGFGKDVWAIDDIVFNRDMTSNLLAVEMMDLPEIDSRLTTNLGKLVDSFCGRMRSVTFSNKTRNGEPRSLVSKDMRVGPGYIAQFDLVMGCGVPYTPGLDNQVYFQYSVDHGISWHLVEDPCLPPDVCDTYRPGTIYHHSQFDHWDTITIVLSPDIWSQQTKFRWMQPDWSETDVWGLNRIYVGYPCPELCNGHGICHSGTCRCFDGFIGETCKPKSQMNSSIRADFGHRYKPQNDFTIRGGNVVRADEGCGIILSGESLYFSQDGVRELLTKNLNTEAADFIQFYIQIGGGGSKCRGADKRKESVLLRYTTNGGITWTLLDELHHMEHRKPTFVHIELPAASKSPNTQFQWWQPAHSGAGNDQWAVDEILIGSYKNLRTLEDDFEDYLEPMLFDQWRLITEGTNGKYCRSTNPSLVMTNQVNDKIAVTNDVHLQPGDVIQFEINVDCGKIFRWDHPVIFQFSHDQGKTWNLVEDPCYLHQDCDGDLTEGSIYYTGTHGQWTLVVIPVTEKIAMHPTIFRWMQSGGVDYSFSIDNLYMGPPCTDNCHNRGVCKNGQCECLDTLQDAAGENCAAVNNPPPGMLDRFDNRNMPSMDFWDRIIGGHLGKHCGVIDYDNALYFGGDGTREAKTVPLNTTHKRILEFSIKIGGAFNSETCRQPRSRNEAVIVDYSTDNGITWKVLKVVEPTFEEIKPSSVVINLPSDARKNRTVFRFWQPLGLGEMPRAEWAIDSVLVGVNETSPAGFEDSFSGPGLMPDPHNWFLADSAVQRETCNSQNNALEFNNKKDRQLAETWDYQVTPSTFLQFDLAMDCGSLSGDLYNIKLDYSTDHGQTWTPVVNECLPPNFECSGYHLSSVYPSNQFSNWTRVTVALPEKAISPSTRFRWLRPSPVKGGPIWALDNVYLGDSCPWLCSGHGVCHNGTCVCDPGFSGKFCVPHDPLPMTFRDDFNSKKSDESIWNEVYGGSNSDICDPVVSGRSFTFDKKGLRVAATKDMDTSMLVSMEFYFKYGCGSEAPFWPRNQSVLLQYSINGGIIWKLIKEIHFSNTSQPKFYTLSLPLAARHNATRFRFWQPANGGELHSIWSVDNLFIGTMGSNPNSLFDNFDAADQPDPMSWTFVNDGAVEEYCSRHNRPSTEIKGQSALVFSHNEGGELSAITSDLEIGPMSVLQFDINIGCGAEATSKYPVRLEYSTDGGSSWSLVGANCAKDSPAYCFESTLPMTVYYAGDSLYWRRIIVPLNHLHFCGTVRFRWYQGKIPDTDFGPEWALDNVYIGMACPDHCNGHGTCFGGMMCQCDPGYSGATCDVETPNPSYLKDDFNGVESSKPKVEYLLPTSKKDTKQKVNEDNWQFWSGGHVTNRHNCGKVFTDANLVQSKNGQRTLTTVPLDLSRANIIQFYLKLGCNKTVNRETPPVFLQYSTNGGIKWTTLEQFDFNPESNKPEYIAVHIPEGALTGATQIRWWQPSKDGNYEEDWAIDQIYIGGNMFGQEVLQDDPSELLNTTWLESPGARVEPVCGSDDVALHFRDKEYERYASTADVMVGEGSVIQFELLMGCDSAKNTDQPCFELTLEYSLDMGNSWQLLKSPCLPSMVECEHYHSSSVFRSDAFIGWNRISVPIPKPAWSTQTRFRIHQAPGYISGQDWAVQHLYVGATCPGKCQGHGRCMESQCLCDEDWGGLDCREPNFPLPALLVEDFLSGYNSSNWVKVVGGKPSQPCQLLSAGEALHFTGPCSRLLVTRALDLSSAMLIQFHFLYGCVNSPTKRDEGVILEYSTNGGIDWHFITEMHYNLFRTPGFVSLKIPEGARKEGTQLRWWQPQNGKQKIADWLIDGIRINGEEINPAHVSINFTSGFEFLDLVTADNMAVGKYCWKEGVAVGRTKAYEPSTLSSRDVKTSDKHVLQFSINVGCGKPWNVSIRPVNVEYSTDHGMTWVDLVSLCFEDKLCQPHSSIAASHYHSVHDNWRRIVLPLHGLPVSNGTRFRWQQLPDGMPDSQDSALADIYIGPSCPRSCSGHGYCLMEQCVCDGGYSGDDCSQSEPHEVPIQLKDTFDKVDNLNATKWPWAQGGHVQTPCKTLVHGPALVFNGPGAREIVTASLDLRDARFIQYTAFMWSKDSVYNLCSQPPDHKVQSVFLQFSNDGGVSWQTLHKLSPIRYWPSRNDYISLPTAARTNNTVVRWVQAETPPMTSPRVHWAIDDVFIGGKEINPSEYSQSFEDEPAVNDDPSGWEFSPNGVIEGDGGECLVEGQSGSAMVWPDHVNKDSGHQMQKFTTNQLIVQPGYMLQFKIIIGCGKFEDVCTAPDSKIKLEFRRNPSTELWEPVQPSCLPGSQNGGLCNPHSHHHASYYNVSQVPVWTRITIPLSEVTFSSTTQFRWIQEGKNSSSAWALDDIYIGERCEDMCSGRGDCIQGVCHCDENYIGPNCLPNANRLLTRLFDSFEGGIFTSHWQTISGGGIGFGCGALLPYAHGKTLYFNGCGERQAITAELDTSDAIKIIFVIQIGCTAQTDNCNVQLGEGPKYRGVLLQYSKNKGAEWYLLAQHDPIDFLRPKRVAYDIPQAAKEVGVQFRWWQPVHDGHGFDQWAIDHVEIISSRRHNKRGRKKN
ncbi:reelin-like [Physella acuta]|uniref:reelin-like n=1 Tax=Physella acuta TaxID=109671 RepID=UPI0027DC0C93|nr:reelin-like [Physella acuta]